MARHWISVRMAGLRSHLSLCSRLGGLLGNDVGLVNRGLNNLLFFRVEVLCEVLVQSGLFLLEACRR